MEEQFHPTHTHRRPFFAGCRCRPDVLNPKSLYPNTRSINRLNDIGVCVDGTGPREVLDFTNRPDQKGGSTIELDEPPRKRLRINGGTEPNCIAVIKQSLVLDYPDKSLNELDSIRTFKSDELLTHVSAYTTDRVCSHYLEISYIERKGKQTRVPLIFYTVDISSDVQEKIRLISDVSHLPQQKYGCAPRFVTGNLWVDTELKLVPLQIGGSRICVSWSLYWNSSPIDTFHRPSPQERHIVRQLWRRFRPDSLFDYDNDSESNDQLLNHGITPQLAYDSFDVPPCPDLVADDIKVQGLTASLFSYQKRSLRWMLRKESVEWSQEHHSLIEGQSQNPPPTLHYKVRDANECEFWISPANNTVSRSNPQNARPSCDTVRGGLLLEEMGLGKTVELIALILLHQQVTHPLHTVVKNGTELHPTGGTLIIAPNTIADQWESEIKRHAPALKIYRYTGLTSYANWSEFKLLNLIAEQDVVLTTYEVMKSEQYHVRRNDSEERERATRHKQQRRSSPLTLFSWWRVVMDEVQMLGAGLSSAARVTSAIPRVHAWGLSGTPIKNKVEHLGALLEFLHYKPATDSAWWQTLMKYDRPNFENLCRHFGVRHTKHLVRTEFEIPSQTRYVLSIPFQKVEEQAYQDIFQTMCNDCHTSQIGDRLNAELDNQSYLLQLKPWLLKLRLSTMYPGAWAKRLQSGHKGKLLEFKEYRSVDQVLDDFLEDTEDEVNIAKRHLAAQKINRAKFLNGGFGIFRPEEAFNVCQEALNDIELALSELELQSSEDYASWQGRLSSLSPFQPEVEEDLALTKSRKGLREVLLLQHTATFLCANGYYQRKAKLLESDPSSEDIASLETLEAEWYEKAKEIRQQLLRNIYQRCCEVMEKLSLVSGPEAIPASWLMPQFASTDLDKAVIHAETEQSAKDSKAFATFIDDHAAFLHMIRLRTVELATRRLVDADDEQQITGDEYENSAKDQEILAVMNQLLWALIEDRNDILNGTENRLVKIEMENSYKLAKGGKGPAPDVVIDYLDRRKAFLNNIPNNLPLSRVIKDLEEIEALLNNEKLRSLELDFETHMVKALLDKLEQWNSEQKEVVKKLRIESNQLLRLVNLRVDYYRQLQAISDEVADWDISKTKKKTADAAYDDMLGIEHRIETTISTGLARLTYYKYLKNQQSAVTPDDNNQICRICIDEIEQEGAMIVCGHIYCKECINAWLKHNKKCPQCNLKIKESDVFYTSYKNAELQVVEEASAQHLLQATRHGNASALYKPLSEDKLKEIVNIRLSGPSLTAKFQMMVKHVFWLRKSDPGAKIIIFSQFRNFLTMLSEVFDKHHIRHTSLMVKGGVEKFRNDPGMECFFMDATMKQSSGLNLTVASHVFLCEPLLHTSIELQAISRVHRIGQTRPTTVWLYIINGTVEENMNAISVRRRLEQAGQFRNKGKGKGKSNGEDYDRLEAVEAADMLKARQELDLNKIIESSKEGKSEVVDTNDIWECLFANRRPVDPAQAMDGIEEGETEQVAAREPVDSVMTNDIEGSHPAQVDEYMMSGALAVQPEVSQTAQLEPPTPEPFTPITDSTTTPPTESMTDIAISATTSATSVSESAAATPVEEGRAHPNVNDERITYRDLIDIPVSTPDTIREALPANDMNEVDMLTGIVFDEAEVVETVAEKTTKLQSITNQPVLVGAVDTDETMEIDEPRSLAE